MSINWLVFWFVAYTVIWTPLIVFAVRLFRLLGKRLVKCEPIVRGITVHAYDDELIIGPGIAR